MSLAGVIIEFVVGGGLRGNRDLAVLGWGVYGLGLLARVVGLSTFSLGAVPEGRRAIGFVSALMTVVEVAWIPLLAAGLRPLALVADAAVGAGWVALATLQVRAHPEADRDAAGA